MKSRSANPWLLRRLLAVALAQALGWPAVPPLAAQQEDAGRIRVDVNLVLVEATVKDKAGRIMDGLTQKDFQLLEDGAPQTITHFSRDQLPLAVALVVDLSASIEPFLRPLHYATQTALRTLKPEDEVALFTFSEHVDRAVDLTKDKRAVSDRFEFFTTGGSTNINDALYEAARYLAEEAPAARRVVILVSDNVPTDAGRVTPKQDEDALLEADSALYSVKIPGRNPPEARMAAKLGGKVNVEKLAEQTGGEVFDVEKVGSLYLAIQALIERLKTRYTLGYTPAKTVRDGRFHNLSVQLAPGRGNPGKDYTVLAKRGYFATPSRTSSR
jgi:Ca-activated chloride channel family protein